MASKKLSYDQLAEPKVLDPLIQEIERLNEMLKVTEKLLKDIVKEGANLAKSTPLESYENIDKVEKAINRTKDAVQDLDKLERERIKLQDRLTDLNDERAKSNALLREEIRQQNKALRDQAKEALTSRNAYQQLTKQTNEAQAEFKRLAAEFGRSSKEAKDARRDFERLDKELRAINEDAKDGRRDVGRYRIATERLGRAFNALAGATVVLKLIEGFTTAFQQNSEGAATLEKGIARLTITFNVLINRIIQGFPIITNIFNRFFLESRIALLESINLFGNFDDKIEETRKQLEELGDGSFEDVFKGISDEIEDLVSRSDRLIDTTLRYRREIVELNKQQSEYIKIQAQLQANADDATQSLEEQIQAQQRLASVNELIADTNIAIAEKNLELAEENARVNKFNVESQEELADATLELANVRAEALAQEAETANELNQLRQDLVEQNLDFLIDDADNIKTVNEQIIANEKESFEERQRLQDENRRVEEEAFRDQVAEINGFLTARGKAELDFEALQQTRSSQAVARIVREAGLSEQLAIRTLEIIRERRIANQDLATSQQELNDSLREGQEIESDLLLTTEALNKLQEEGADLNIILQKLSDQRLQNEIDNLRLRLAVAQEGSKEFLDVQAELNEKLLEQQQNRINQQVQQEEEGQQRAIELQQATFTILSEASNRFFEQRQMEIDRELSAEQDRANQLQQLAAEGNETAERNLALSQQRQAQLELQREQQRRRQAQAELALTAIETYSAKVSAGDDNALASTITDIQLLQSFIAALPTFFEGAEHVGDALGKPQLPGRDGHIVRVDGSERVLNGEHNKMIPKSMSNFELAMIAHREGRDRRPRVDDRLLQEVRNLTQAVTDKETYLGMDFSKQEEAVTFSIKKGQKLERRHKKIGGIWGN